jgi:hypothetical protein
MKVMWNIRLFKGMQLLPRQVSDGDRRMDVYVKMVLVDDGQPKSYAIKVLPPNISCAHSSYETTCLWISFTLLSNGQSPRDNNAFRTCYSYGELDCFVFEVGGGLYIYK